MATVLTVVTGTFLVPLQQVQDLVQHMTGGPVPPHLIRQASRACRDYLREQYGWMAGVSLNPDEEDSAKWLAYWEKERGATMGVPVMPQGRFVIADPIAEFAKAGGFGGDQ